MVFLISLSDTELGKRLVWSKKFLLAKKYTQWKGRGEGWAGSVELQSRSEQARSPLSQQRGVRAKNTFQEYFQMAPAPRFEMNKGQVCKLD